MENRQTASIQGKRSAAFFSSGLFAGILLILAGIAVNVAGAFLADFCPFPVFLDSIGTVLAASLGGYIPGVAVGFLSNLINGISDPDTMYYGVISIMIAFMAVQFSRKRWYKKPGRMLLTILVYALIGGGIGSILTWNLYGGGFGEGISAAFAHYLYDNSIRSVFLAQLTADIVIDLADKAITVAVVFVVMYLLPKTLIDRLNFHGWKDADRRSVYSGTRFKWGMSLKMRVVMLIGSSCIIVAGVVSSISLAHYHNMLLNDRMSFGSDVAKLVASKVDGNRVEEYLEKGEAAPGFAQTKAELQSIRDNSSNIDFIYVYKILEDGCHVVFDTDTKELSGTQTGAVIPFDEGFSEGIEDLLAGREIAPIVTNDTYGWLLTIYVPVYDDNGICQCYAGADISMERISSAERIFFTKIISLFGGFLILLLSVGIFFAQAQIIGPINSMANAASAFAYTSAESREETIERLRNLNIQTGDEIEHLYRAMVKTTEDTAHYIANAEEQNETISRLQNGLIVVMADLVESRDKCTGDHIKNTAAYVRILMEQMREEGIYADAITNDYIEDVVNSAPLHDLGKIRVSDMILNKPGKLTEDEFETMKLHTLAGAEAIDDAMDKVDVRRTGYMREARHMALSHHEKWNGSGYPYGLRGEEIPLSARIMAVADVFDALVSRRSYKDEFPFETAMQIIHNSAGTHFDPQLVKAFEDASDRVRKYLEEQNVAKARADLAAQTEKTRAEQEARKRRERT